MTWENIVDSNTGGNGKVEYRLKIQGYDYSFVTSQAMANNTSMPKRINGLVRKGLNLTQEIMLPEAILRLNSNNVSIVDYQEQATIAFYRKPSYTGYLTQDAINPYEISLYVSSINGLSIGDYLWMGSECIKVLGFIPGDLNQIIVQRGALDTTPQAHYTLTDLGIPVKPFIQNVPYTIQNKRAWLYAYGEGDDPQGEGTLVWRGVVLKQPILQGTNYAFEIGPITELLKQEIGTDSEELKLRGINLGIAKWSIKMEFLSGLDVKTSSVTSTSFISASGYYEDIYKLVEDLNNQAIENSKTSTVKAGVTLSQTGEMLFTQFAQSTTSIRYSTTYNPLNAITKGDSASNKDIFEFEPENSVYAMAAFGQPRDLAERSVVKNATYTTRLKSRSFPKQLMIYANNAPIPEAFRQYFSGENFNRRLYINSDVNSNMTDISFVGEDGNFIATTQYSNSSKADIVINETDRWIEVPLLGAGAGENYGCFLIADNDKKLQIGTSYNQLTSTQTLANNVVDFLEVLIDQSPTNMSNGLISILTTDDIDIDDMRTQINKLSLKPYQNQRKYVFYKKAGSLEKLLNEEFKLIGVYPCLTVDGKLTIRPLRNIHANEEPDYTFDSDDILTDMKYPSIETDKYGTFNSVAIKTGYNSVTDKYEGATIVQRNIDSITQIGKQKQITIEPKSMTQYVPNNPSAFVADFEDILYRMTSMFAKSYSVVNFDVPIKYFTVPIGSIVRIKNKQLPNYTPNFSYLTSRRGSGRILGRVTGKSFDFEKGFGNLTVLVSDREFEGADVGSKAIYAPDAIGSITDLGGNFYRFTFNTNFSGMFVPSNQTQSAFWNVGDGVMFLSWNATPVDFTGRGKIISVSGTGNDLTIIVDCNTSVGGQIPTYPGTYEYIIKPANFDSVLLNEAQKIYTYIDAGSLDASYNVNYPGNLNRVYSF